MDKKTPMDQDAKARIMALEATKSGGGVEKGSFGARAQAAADMHEAAKDGGSQSK